MLMSGRLTEAIATTGIPKARRTLCWKISWHKPGIKRKSNQKNKGFCPKHPFFDYFCPKAIWRKAAQTRHFRLKRKNGDNGTRTRYLRIFLFCTFLSGIQILCANFFPAIGKVKLGMVCSLSRQVFFQLPLLLCFPLFWGMDGVLFAGPIADAMAAILSLSLVRFQLNSQDS
jgi:Na+-driven multidrug efflux pump